MDHDQLCEEGSGLLNNAVWREVTLAFAGDFPLERHFLGIPYQTANAGTRVLGYLGPRVLGYAGRRVLSYEDIKVRGYSGNEGIKLRGY